MLQGATKNIFQTSEKLEVLSKERDDVENQMEISDMKNTITGIQRPVQ